MCHKYGGDISYCDTDSIFMDYKALKILTDPLHPSGLFKKFNISAKDLGALKNEYPIGKDQF